VQPGERVHGVSQIAVLAVQIENCEPNEFCVRRSGNPPACKLRRARVGGGESYGIERQARSRRRAHHQRRRMVEQLPTALPEEKTQPTPRAKNGCADDEGYRAQQPAARNPDPSRRIAPVGMLALARGGLLAAPFRAASRDLQSLFLAGHACCLLGSRSRFAEPIPC